MVISEDSSRLLKPDLSIAALTRSELVPVQQNHRGNDFAGARVKADFGSVLELSGCTGEKIQVDFDHVGGLQGILAGKDISPFNGSLLDPLEVDGGAKTRMDLIDFLVINLNPPYLALDPLGVTGSLRPRFECGPTRSSP